MDADRTSKTEVGLKLKSCSNCDVLVGQRPVSGFPSPRRFWPSGLKYGYAGILRLSLRFSRPPLLCRTPGRDCLFSHGIGLWYKSNVREIAISNHRLPTAGLLMAENPP